VREECILEISENRVLGRIFGPKTEKVAGVWRRLYIKYLHNLYSSSAFQGLDTSQFKRK
jgi:hypothetical protein